jgi:hypothetical protein
MDNLPRQKLCELIATYTQPARNKPLTGKGDFKFLQTGQECLAGSWWAD